MSVQIKAKSPVGLTIGVDVGDKFSHICVLGSDGEVQEEARIRTTPSAFAQWFRSASSSRVVLEAGTHSPWISRLIAAGGHETIVANPAVCVSSTRATARAIGWMPSLLLVWGGLIRDYCALSSTEERKPRQIWLFCAAGTPSFALARCSLTT